MKRSQALRALHPILVDVAAPIALYYGLTQFAGVADLPALLAGGGLAALDALVSAAIQRRLRLLPIFVAAMFVISGTVAYLLHDARVVLLKPSFVAAVIGLYFLSLAARRDALLTALEPALARAPEARAERLRQAWKSQAPLRRTLRLSCLAIGLLIFAEAAARAAIVLNVSIGRSVILSHGPSVALIVIVLLIGRFVVRPAVLRALADQP